MILGEESKPPLDELVHFGVKGMRWGIRKDRTYDATQSKAERKAASKNYGKFASAVVQKKYADDKNLFERKISPEQYAKLSTKTVSIRKGQTVRRVSKREDENYGEMTYVSYKKGDQDVYRAVMSTMGTFKLGGNKRYKPSYEHTFKAVETLKSPSEKERVDAFVELFDHPSITLKNGKTVTGREFVKDMGFRKEAKTLDAQQLGLRFYKSFTEDQYMNTPINSAYFKKIQEKGYNALLDDNDRGHLAEAPVIVLNPNGTLKRMGVKRLSADDVNTAMARLKVPEVQ
jgi:hypothetical protein